MKNLAELEGCTRQSGSALFAYSQRQFSLDKALMGYIFCVKDLYMRNYRFRSESFFLHHLTRAKIKQAKNVFPSDAESTVGLILFIITFYDTQ